MSEDDGPERRLRLGFASFEDIREALDMLLDIQPGYEEVLFWSAVRHDHIEIVRYLIGLGWNIETRWKGLTMLHTAILYGRTELVKYLMDEGADSLAKTQERSLTTLHLLMLERRPPETDVEIFDLIASRVEVDARENVNQLTAFHLAVRNQKPDMVQRLLLCGASPYVPLTEKIDLISQGRNGYLADVPGRPRIFTDAFTILGEVLVQQIQDEFYPQGYVADLLVVFLGWLPLPITERSLVIDAGNGMTLLHLLALTDAPDADPRPTIEDWYGNFSQTKVISLFYLKCCWEVAFA